jgi:hypothetical protein
MICDVNEATHGCPMKVRSSRTMPLPASAKPRWKNEPMSAKKKNRLVRRFGLPPELGRQRKPRPMRMAQQFESSDGSSWHESDCGGELGISLRALHFQVRRSMTPRACLKKLARRHVQHRKRGSASLQIRLEGSVSTLPKHPTRRSPNHARVIFKQALTFTPGLQAAIPSGCSADPGYG